MGSATPFIKIGEYRLNIANIAYFVQAKAKNTGIRSVPSTAMVTHVYFTGIPEPVVLTGENQDSFLSAIQTLVISPPAQT